MKRSDISKKSCGTEGRENVRGFKKEPKEDEKESKVWYDSCNYEENAAIVFTCTSSAYDWTLQHFIKEGRTLEEHTLWVTVGS